MRSFEFELPVLASPQRVLEEFWNLESWPAVARHVRGIDLMYGDPAVQVLWMTVATRGRIDRFQSVRVRERDAIHYIQPQPPRILRHHHGSWHFRPSADGCVVTSRHAIVVDVEVARVVLSEIGNDVESAADVEQAIEQLIHDNSRQTMTVLKRRIEEEVSDDRHDTTA